jgi:hypothetical protein
VDAQSLTEQLQTRRKRTGGDHYQVTLGLMLLQAPDHVLAARSEEIFIGDPGESRQRLRFVPAAHHAGQPGDLCAIHGLAVDDLQSGEQKNGGEREEVQPRSLRVAMGPGVCH